MRHLIRLLAVVAVLVPTAAFAQITSSRHNLSSSSTAEIKSNRSEICIFCHAPHGAQSTQMLWNHTPTARATWNWGNDLDGAALTATTESTPLPTAAIYSASKRCLACHDGSIALGDVTNPGLGMSDPTFADVAGAVASNLLTRTTSRVGFNGNMGGNHPVSVPYAGQTYHAVASGVPATRVVAGAGSGGYYPTQVGGTCTSPSGLCTTGPGGAAINLIPTTAGGNANMGVECTSCHEPHNKGNNGHMLVMANTDSALCLACHSK